jgi:hypothetical protein
VVLIGSRLRVNRVNHGSGERFDGLLQRMNQSNLADKKQQTTLC